MNSMEINIFKLLAGSILKSEFESELYQEQIVTKINSDEFIEDLININFRANDWKTKLEAIALEYFGKDYFINQLIKYNCLKIIESFDKEVIFRINSNLARKYAAYDYENELLAVFYCLEDELGYTREGFGHRKEELIAKEIKSAARMFLNQLQNQV
ncbi:MAG: hypothetical protein AAF600_11260 [Bacteroidota bacterium]